MTSLAPIATAWRGHPSGGPGRDPSSGRALPDRRRGCEGQGQATQPDRRAEGPAPRRESTEQAAAESALLKLYTEVWLPRAEAGGIGIEKIAAGGRPLQTTLNDKKQAMIHERIVELITSVQQRVFSSLKPGKLVELFKLGDPEGASGAPSGSPTVGISTAEVVDGMYGFSLGFTRSAGRCLCSERLSLTAFKMGISGISPVPSQPLAPMGAIRSL